MSVDRRRALRIGGWSLFGLAQLSLHIWPSHLIVLYSLYIMLATCAGTVLHTVATIRAKGRTRWFWATTALGLGCWAFAEVSVGVHAVITGVALGRGLVANVLNLGSLVLAVVAMLAVPTAPRTAGGKLRMVLDGIVAATSLLGTAWILVLAKMTKFDQGSSSAAVFDLAYPVLAAGVLSVALVMLAGQPLRRATAMTSITAGVAAVTASLFTEITADATGATWLRPWVLGGYVAAAALMAIAPLAPLPQRHQRTWQPTGVAGALVPYIPVALFISVAMLHSMAGQKLDKQVTFSGVLMVVAVFGRQFLALRLNAALTLDLAEERTRFAREAVHDALTGLPNRAAVNAALADLDRPTTGLTPTDRPTTALPTTALPTTGRAGDDPGAALLMIDLDGFKTVNDTLGHAAGDELLTVVAGRLRTVVGPDSLAARLGGDEFAVLLHTGDPLALAARIQTAFAEPMVLSGRPATVRASIGMAVRTPGMTPERLLHHADLALYEAKNHDKGGIRRFDESMSAAIEARRTLENDLVRALEDGQLRLLYQPIVDVRTGDSHSAEALVRWQHPERGWVGPDEFLPAAQEVGLLPDIDRWVLATAATQLAAWRAVDPQYTVSVNVSAPYLATGTVIDDVRRVLRANRLPGLALTVEVTETSLIADLEAAARSLRELRGLGVRVALDDFGVGYSSLTYLRQLPVDVVKIDRSFIQDLDRDPQAAILVGAVLALVHGLGLTCVAEGIEDPGQLNRLRALHCDRAQGFLFSRPQPPERIVVTSTEPALAA